MEERLIERRGESRNQATMLIPGLALQKPIQAMREDGVNSRETAQNMKQDKEVAHSAPPSASVDSGKWETHVTRKDSKRLGTEERRRLRQVAFQLGPDLLKRMSEDSELMECVHGQIEEAHYLDRVLSDRYRRDERVPGLIHGMVKALTEGLRRYGNQEEGNKGTAFAIPKRYQDDVVRFGLRLAFLGAETLIDREENIDA